MGPSRGRERRSYVPKLFGPLWIRTHMALLQSDHVISCKVANAHLEVSPNMIYVFNIWNNSISNARQEYLPVFMYTMHHIGESRQK